MPIVLVRSSLFGPNERAFGPLRQLGFQQLDLVAADEPEVGSANSSTDGDRALSAFQTACRPVHGGLPFGANQTMEQKFHWQVVGVHKGESSMEAAIERVMKTYGMIVNMTFAQEQVVREKVSHFLQDKVETDEQKLTIEGLRYARGISIADL
jgi:hypothetical protein